MNLDSSLPPAFATLEPFVFAWALERTEDRAAKRSASTPGEREAFFAVASPLLDEALDYLDSQRLQDLASPDRRLMNLMLALAHVALAVEIQGPDEVKSGPWRDRMRITRSTADEETR
jgi:hypothetical protein